MIATSPVIFLFCRGGIKRDGLLVLVLMLGLVLEVVIIDNSSSSHNSSNNNSTNTNGVEVQGQLRVVLLDYDPSRLLNSFRSNSLSRVRVTSYELGIGVVLGIGLGFEFGLVFSV